MSASKPQSKPSNPLCEGDPDDVLLGVQELLDYLGELEIRNDPNQADNERAARDSGVRFTLYKLMSEAIGYAKGGVT